MQTISAYCLWSWKFSEEKRENGRYYFKKPTWNFLTLGKETNTQVQEAQENVEQDGQNSQGHIIDKILKVKRDLKNCKKKASEQT